MTGLGLPQRQLGRFLQCQQRVGGDEAGFQVGQGFDAVVVFGVAGRLLFDGQGDEEAELGDLAGDGLDVYAVDAVLDKVEFAPEIGVAVSLEGGADFVQFGVAFLLIFRVEGKCGFLAG